MTVLEARHPVVERRTPSGDPFVPNDVTLNGVNCQLVILTGPNMGGKSTYLRQTALLCVMAQAGSFVPARDAKIPLVDRIFARVGASDNIARGHSTFMVEMQETAHILHTATSRSLVVLDEIGRGTATFDGLSIAWAVAEFLATNPKLRPKTLFATHYHELTDLADATPGVVAFLEERGYEEVRRYVISELDVAAADDPGPPAFPLVTFAERPDLVEAIFAIARESYARTT